MMSNGQTDLLAKIADILTRVKQQRPLVHHITNYVTVNDCANITLALGASPVMASDIAEVEEMVSHAAALVLNIGTLSSEAVTAMVAAGKKANSLGVPVIFDPVGVGATALRTAAAEQIIREVRLAVIRGNMSEIKVLAGLNTGIKGVDSIADEQGGVQAAQNLAKQLGCTVAITGKTDIVVRGADLCLINNGHPLLTAVTGTGCMATSLIGCCCGATDEYFAGAAAGIAVMGIAGELAQRALKPEDGIGTFRMRLFDAVFTMTPAIIREYGRIEYHGRER